VTIANIGLPSVLNRFGLSRLGIRMVPQELHY
jgi:hypothetical protein